MRIVGGAFRGRPLVAPKGLSTRPTTDRARETLFNILAHREDVRLEGLRVIDLFAGSGALGIEALSRGAAWCLFVEEAAPARAAIRQNIETLGLFGQTKIHRRSATGLGTLPASAQGPFDLAFLDAPYDKGLSGPALEGLRKGGWLHPHALCIVEQGKRESATCPGGFEELDRREMGEAQIGFLRLTDSPDKD